MSARESTAVDPVGCGPDCSAKSRGASLVGAGCCALLLALPGACASEDLLAGLPDAAIPDAAAPDATPGCQPIVYLNGTPTTFLPGFDDSVANRSQVIDVQVTTAGAPVDYLTWQAAVECVTELLAPFGVVVTDVDPGAVDHIEIVVTDSAMELGLAEGFVSSAPLACPPTLRRGIGFVYARTMADDPRALCEAIAWPVGAIAGLSASYDCRDVMGFHRGCGDREFLDEDVQCGGFEPDPCVCTGATTQNSYETMSQWFGAYCDGAE